MRLIDADALKEYLDICECCDKCPNKKLNCNADCTLPDFLTDDWERIINEQSTVQPQRMRGHRIKDERGYTRCDQCGSRLSAVKANYCSHCGADMREDEQDD